MRILVEEHAVPEIKLFMDTVALSVQARGHEVVRWNESRYQHAVADLAFIWNPLAGDRSRFVGYWRKQGIPSMCAELGWFPQRKTYQVDPHGINMAASWAGTPVPFTAKNRIKISVRDKVLVLLQSEGDTQLACFSPWVSLKGLVELVARNAPQKIVVRKHPYNPPSQDMVSFVQSFPGASWDDSPSLSAALDRYDLIATLNSSSAVEAMLRGKAVLCFGEALYRVRGAVACMTEDPALLRETLTNLDAIPIWVEAQKAVAHAMLARQWTVDTIPTKLEGLLRSIPKY